MEATDRPKEPALIRWRYCHFTIDDTLPEGEVLVTRAELKLGPGVVLDGTTGLPMVRREP